MSKLKNLADFMIRIIMLFTTFVTLLFFAEKYNTLVFSIIFIMLAISLAIKGVINVFKKD